MGNPRWKILTASKFTFLGSCNIVLIVVGLLIVVIAGGIGASDRIESSAEKTGTITTATEPSVLSTGFDCVRSSNADSIRSGVRVITQGPQRESAERFMLMMQGMAGIGPAESPWVLSRLFEGFIPAPMPCCGLPGSKSEDAEHQCCDRQKLAIGESARAEKAQRAFVHFGKQFGRSESLTDQYLRLGIAPSRKYPLPVVEQLPVDFQVPDRTPDGREVMSRRKWERAYRLVGTAPLPGGYEQYLQSMGVLPGQAATAIAFAQPPQSNPAAENDEEVEGTEAENSPVGIHVEVLPGQTQPAEVPEGARHFRVAAIGLDVVYNRFGGHNSSGMVFVLEDELERVVAGARPIVEVLDDAVTVRADSEDGDFFWALDNNQSKDLTVPVKVGDRLVFQQTDSNMTHGLKFVPDEGWMEFLEPLEGGAGLNEFVPPVAEGEVTLIKQFRVIKAITESIPFQCVVHLGNMKGRIEAAEGDTVTVRADSEDGDFFWALDNNQSQDLTVPVKVGDRLVFEQTDSNMGHGLKFVPDEGWMEFLEPLEGGAGLNEFVPAVAEGEVTLIEQFRVIKAITESIPFQCVVHLGNMKGRIVQRREQRRDMRPAFNAGHDPLYFGLGRGGNLFLKDPATGELVLDEEGEPIPVLTAEPLVIRANQGETVVIDFTNRMNVKGLETDNLLANLTIEGAQYDFSALNEPADMVPEPNDDPSFAGYHLRYILTVHDNPASRGTYYFHSQPVLPDNRDEGLENMRTQIAHGLFGALIIEPSGSHYYDVAAFAIKEGSKNGFGDYEVDPAGYVETKSGWGAIVTDGNPTDEGPISSFREYVIFFHDDLNKKVSDLVETDPRALSYRTEPFNDIFNSHPGFGQPFAVRDKSMAYSAYTYGDSSTPHPRFYVGDPMRYRIIHAGMGDQFHVFHHHAHRWRFQPGIQETGAEGDTANLTRTSKWGRPEFPEQPDLTRSASTRIDSQTLGPGETFDVLMEGGAGGVQRTVGDALLHCHIIQHVLQGMWTYARVFNTLQRPDWEHIPPLAPLPDRLDEKVRPPIAVDSLTLENMVKDPQAPKPKPVSGPLAGVRMTNVANQLRPFIENQLPPMGRPEKDKEAHPTDTVKTNRANVWDWTSRDFDAQGRLYLGEPYDVSGPGLVHFGVGFPTKAEGVGVDRNETDPNGDKLDRPKLMFNPKDGRLANPHLLPRAGWRPPFAPRTKLVAPAVPGEPWKVEKAEFVQGTAYLGPDFKQDDLDWPHGAPRGSGLAPENRKSVKHYDLVTIELPINYSAHNGATIPPAVDFGTGVVESGTQETITVEGINPAVWKPSEIVVHPGDVIKWIAKDKNHGLRFTEWDDTKKILDIDLDPAPAIGLPLTVTGNVAETKGAENPETLLVRATVMDFPVGLDFQTIPFECSVHGVAMSGRISLGRSPLFLEDPTGQIFALRDDVPDIMSGRKPAEPLVIRANVGDVVDITLASALTDTDENFGYSKVGIHTHLVQYDAQSSDGAVGGLNYETSIRPSLEWDGEQLKPIAGEEAFEERVHYRWWCDVELGTVYWHDHSLLITSLPHGLFGATIVEPARSKYHDPIAGDEIYTTDTNGRIGGTNTMRGVATADIRLGPDSFREYVPLFNDGNWSSINLRSEPLKNRYLKSSGGDELRLELNVTFNDDGPILTGGKATAFSSRLYGDPVTPLWRAFAGDPMRIRVEGSGTNQIHAFHLDGHRWRFESGNPLSTERDFVLAGVSEAFTFNTTANTVSQPGDYLYGSTGTADLVDQGKWGLLRLHEPGENVGEKATGIIRVYIDRPATVTVPAGKEFYSAKGVKYIAVDAVNLTAEIVEGNTAFQFGGDVRAFYFDVEVEAIEETDLANAPVDTLFGVDPKGMFESPDGKEVSVVQIQVESAVTSGKTTLQLLPR